SSTSSREKPKPLLHLHITTLAPATVTTPTQPFITNCQKPLPLLYLHIATTSPSHPPLSLPNPVVNHQPPETLAPPSPCRNNHQPQPLPQLSRLSPAAKNPNLATLLHCHTKPPVH
ncbi:unnamed protein product, partial [Ilex paraguariensis]